MKKQILIVLLAFWSLVVIAQPSTEKFQELVAAYANQQKFNGVVLVAQKGKILFEQSYGYRDAKKKIEHDVQDVFQVGSVTKQFTAAIIMQLQQEGKLSVQDKLSKYFPGFTNADKITIEHLLTHTSGLYNYTNDTVLLKSDVTRSYKMDELVAIFAKYKPDFEPGTNWNYSNTAYSMLGYIIEKVTGKPYETAVRQRILQPLNMVHSGFDFTHLNASGKSKGYFVLSGPVVVPAPIVDSTIAFSAGALYSTVEDLLKWERAIYTNQVLMPETWKKVFTPYKNKYGYGWFIDSVAGKFVTAHSGGIHGFSSYLLRIPEDELTVILLDNTSSSSLNAMSRKLAAIALGKPYELPPVKKELHVDKAILESYVGEYELSPGFTINVTLEENKLFGQATGQGKFELFAESEKIFFLKVVPAKVEFIKDGSGKVTSLVLHQNGKDLPGDKIK